MQTFCRRLPSIPRCEQPGRPPEFLTGPRELGTVGIQKGYALQRIKMLYNVYPPWQISLKTHIMYELCGVLLSCVETEKYIGITLLRDLSWNPHITKDAITANHKLGCLKRNLKGCQLTLKIWQTCLQLEHPCSMQQLSGTLIWTITRRHSPG